jgi:GT2 family glycosyltransferase
MNLTIVVVLYKQKPEDSKTFLTLNRSLISQHNDLNNIELVLYDNSLEKYAFSPLEYEGIHISYVHDPRNLGIATAYNYALKKANQNGSQWLLLLDHDTELTDDYITEIFNIYAYPKEVAAIVPKVTNDQTMISPIYSHSLRPLTEDRPGNGLQEQPVMAINSGSLIRVDFLNEVGGFNEEFALDYLDHWLFFEIYARGKKVWVLDVILEHELSVMDYNRVSLNRYKSILESEGKFYKDYRTDLLPAYQKQLFKRFLKQVLTVKDKKIALETFRRLFL